MKGRHHSNSPSDQTFVFYGNLGLSSRFQVSIHRSTEEAYLSPFQIYLSLRFTLLVAVFPRPRNTRGRSRRLIIIEADMTLTQEKIFGTDSYLRTHSLVRYRCSKAPPLLFNANVASFTTDKQTSVTSSNSLARRPGSGSTHSLIHSRSNGMVIIAERWHHLHSRNHSEGK